MPTSRDMRKKNRAFQLPSSIVRALCEIATFEEYQHQWLPMDDVSTLIRHLFNLPRSLKTSLNAELINSQ